MTKFHISININNWKHTSDTDVSKPIYTPLITNRCTVAFTDTHMHAGAHTHKGRKVYIYWRQQWRGVGTTQDLGTTLITFSKLDETLAIIKFQVLFTEKYSVHFNSFSWIIILAGLFKIYSTHPCPCRKPCWIDDYFKRVRSQSLTGTAETRQLHN